MEITYSPAQQVDIEAIYTFCSQLIADFETDPIDLEKVLPWCKRKISSQITEYQRILKDGELAGYFHLSPMEDGSLELDDFYLLEAFRGQGIGSAVLKELCASADQQKKTLVLYVFKKNEAAVRLYERCDFVITDKAGNSRWIMTRESK